eukprot:4940045-Prymnesium_polylepis.1
MMTSRTGIGARPPAQQVWTTMHDRSQCVGGRVPQVRPPRHDVGPRRSIRPGEARLSRRISCRARARSIRHDSGSAVWKDHSHDECADSIWSTAVRARVRSAYCSDCVRTDAVPTRGRTIGSRGGALNVSVHCAHRASFLLIGRHVASHDDRRPGQSGPVAVIFGV